MAILVFITVSSTQAQKTAANDLNIAEYFKNLPEKYITASGDFEKPAAENMVFDEKNGYAAAYVIFPPRPEMSDEKFPTFELALFKSQSKAPLLVVANQKSDSVCTDYETFFLRRVGNNWTEVSREVLPPMNLKMFWDKQNGKFKFAK